jgi:hypothetical protein
MGIVRVGLGFAIALLGFFRASRMLDFVPGFGRKAF